MTTTEKVIPRLKLRYRSEIAPALHKDFSYENVMQIPGVVKIVVNMGVGDAARDGKLIEGAVATWPRSPASVPRFARPASPSRSSSCVRACRSARAARCAATGCGSSSTGC